MVAMSFSRRQWACEIPALISYRPQYHRFVPRERNASSDVSGVNTTAHPLDRCGV